MELNYEDDDNQNGSQQQEANEFMQGIDENYNEIDMDGVDMDNDDPFDSVSNNADKKVAEEFGGKQKQDFSPQARQKNYDRNNKAARFADKLWEKSKQTDHSNG